MSKEVERIPIASCIKGRVYKIRSRNLRFGVYDGNEGFIGIRTKFGRRYLDTEYHWDQGPPYGTVRTMEDLWIDVPKRIQIVESIGTKDATTDRLIEWKEDIPNPNGSLKNVMGWWVFVTSGEPCPSVDEFRAVGLGNPELFAFLDTIEKTYGEEEE